MRDLSGVIEREGAQIGVLITLQEPGKPMITEAASAGFYKSPWDNNNYARLQILTIKQLLEGKRVEMPNTTGINATFKRAPKAQREDNTTQPAMPGMETEYSDDEEDDEE